jgi:[ribosomal protein S18]-alanine N-acetyltransferase
MQGGLGFGTFVGRRRGYNGGVAFRIRQFQKGDFDTLWRIDQDCFDPMLAYSRPEMAFYMRRAGAFTLVAEANEASDGSIKAGSGEVGAGTPEILGFIVTEFQRRKGHIITIDVVAAARRLGVGSAMLGAAEAQLRESGAEAVVLEVAVNNEAAIRFYKEKGYFVEKTVRGYYSNQLDALVMEKVLVESE